MKVSQLLPVRPEPNTQMMFSGRMPISSPASLLASIDKNAAISCSCFASFKCLARYVFPQFKIHVNLGLCDS
jgi:hypothetical protein